MKFNFYTSLFFGRNDQFTKEKYSTNIQFEVLDVVPVSIITKKV
jgi:hypothetical protein